MESYPLLYYVVPRHIREIKQPVSLNIHFNVTKGENLMEFNEAIGIAVGCVMASALKNNEKREVINELRKIEEITELVEYREYDDSEIVDMIEKLLRTNTQSVENAKKRSEIE